MYRRVSISVGVVRGERGVDRKCAMDRRQSESMVYGVSLNIPSEDPCDCLNQP